MRASRLPVLLKYQLIEGRKVTLTPDQGPYAKCVKHCSTNTSTLIRIVHSRLVEGALSV